MGSMATNYGVHYKRLLVVTELFNIAVNDFDAQKSARYSRVLLVTVLVVSVNPRYKVEIENLTSSSKCLVGTMKNIIF